MFSSSYSYSIIGEHSFTRDTEYNIIMNSLPYVQYYCVFSISFRLLTLNTIKVKTEARPAVQPAQPGQLQVFQLSKILDPHVLYILSFRYSWSGHHL